MKGSPLLNFLFPPLCPFCSTITPEIQTACSTCWPKITFISDPFCPQCAFPFGAGPLESPLNAEKCPNCLMDPPAFSETRCVYVYDDFSKQLVLSFKHGQALYLAPLLAQWIFQKGSDLLETADLLIPVPLHWYRLYLRGFNQAALLGNHLAKLTQKPLALNALKRIKNTPPQGTLSPEDRHKNMARAFKVSRKEKIKNKRIVLIDDVLTTGATTHACAKELLAAGAQKVSVLCVARVLR